MKDFKTLQVWHKAHDFALQIYRVTQDFPSEEKFGLVSQLRRSASSIPTNIAEGCGRNRDADFARFLDMAMGSASEAEYQVLLCRDLGYLAPEMHTDAQDELEEIKRMLIGLIHRIRPKLNTES